LLEEKGGRQKEREFCWKRREKEEKGGREKEERRGSSELKIEPFDGMKKEEGAKEKRETDRDLNGK